MLNVKVILVVDLCIVFCDPHDFGVRNVIISEDHRTLSLQDFNFSVVKY